MNIIVELEWRGAINQQTDEAGLKDYVENHSISLYCGVDPTGDSLHIGHLIPFIMLKRFQLQGHRPVILIGGATGSIGDPSGRSEERQLQSMEVVNENARKLTAQMEKLFLKDPNAQFRLVNNYAWTKDLSLLDFLRDYGKLFNINTMLAKDVVASRLEHGISFTEFTYQILQSMDFLHLYREEDVRLQIGGADQWGNITSGLDLIRKVEGPEAKAFGLTIPLMLKADGTKFGKTAGGAVWLDPEKTSPYEFYQFWVNQDDADVVKYLKYFTFLSKEEIAELAEKVATEPHKREAQKTLAKEMTLFVHGEEGLADALSITEALFSGDIKNLSAKQIEQGFNNMPGAQVPRETANLAVWLVDNGVESSRRQSREDIKNGAIYINGERIQDIDYEISPADAIEDKYIVVRRGKKKYFLMTFAD
ncbi:MULTISPECIES: tyrosine--tRNA ligase [Aerococcus]|uniref:tyrosine--tRNA ligase n=1 Tax=Aerococcus urinae (strain CCUG 59500 / ACS-120-V-Col10a) TaxID=2976812 RepID=UPI000200E587|nr:tyrosine--tRNA ligase [Aerococcus sp. Group 1]AEA01075.1 tyrosine--tRNA ligase [Aerococcus sp. Group 1]MCY3030068.1 tyrosine--tRNA ligase [Aerococcus sp. Group 1]MCY3054381.1 tyrosine--tRNA ligase [Aerococcus sp. Group 1]MCY3056111.1 tyrosine--tRNA ligase [Aerococcus sp. Group 1]MCY3061134.1 tyrosine--tRNA ligase [Aerococcus sp. Group 1]